MVKSGLMKKPDYHISPKVSVYRLFVHLNMAMVIFSFLSWNAYTLLRVSAESTWTLKNFKKMKNVRSWTIAILSIISVNIASGAIVAGLDAGSVFQTWPLMNGAFFPSGYWRANKGINNIFENMAHVQFNHRTFAYLTYSATTIVFWKYIFSALPI